MTSPELVVCVPGPWKTRNDLVMAVGKQSGDYLYAGVAMMNKETREAVTVQFEEPNPNLGKAFAIAGRSWLDEATFTEIDRHSSCVYLITKGGSEETAKKMMLAAAALLKCGGIAIKIESTGIAHPAKKWEEWSADPELPTLFRAYVTYIGSGDVFYSCGMHNLGYPDCVVQAEIEPQTAAELIDAFLRYLLFDDPELESGQTFSVKAEAPRYKIEHQACTMFEPDHLFHNPYGVWKLTPAG